MLGGGGSDQEQIDLVRQFNMTGLPALLLPEGSEHRIAGKRTQGEGGNELSGGFRHHHMHLSPALAQLTGEVRRPVGRNRSGNAEGKGLAGELTGEASLASRLLRKAWRQLAKRWSR